ncbi:MAG: outer membrane protein assembly factor BamB [Betaproteobacteria bacterium RIFCSPLOWO2_12_FULL_68_19]|nr:MAG: outer membrane protein assembly factor BamB [Betaproteobacteria bacterium RIFCSPLOWO2_12_FULL_68_19]
MRLARACAAAAAAALASCSSAPTGPKPAALPELAGAQTVRVLWRAEVGAAEDFFFAPALVGEAVFAAARDGTVSRLDAGSGTTRWRVAAGTRLSAGVGADRRSVAVASEEGEVVVLDADSGKLRWRARVSSEVLAAPTVGAGLVLVRSIDNRIFAFGAEDGKRRWVYQRAPSSLIVRTPAGAVIDGDSAYAGFGGGKLAAIALSNGGLRWEATVALPRGSTELERVTDVVGDPVVLGREVCAAAYQGRVGCYETANGRQIWARELSTLTGVSIDARYAFAADERGALHALDRSTGRSVWKQDRLAHRQLSLPLPAGNAIAVGDFEGYVHFLARESGALLARHDTGGGAVRAAPLALPSGLLVQTVGGALHALAL